MGGRGVGEGREAGLGVKDGNTATPQQKGIHVDSKCCRASLVFEHCVRSPMVKHTTRAYRHRPCLGTNTHGCLFGNALQCTRVCRAPMLLACADSCLQPATHHWRA